MTWIVLLFPFFALAQLEIHPVEPANYRAGDTVEVRLRITDKESFNTLSPLELQKSSIDKALWFRRVNTWVLSDDALTTQASIVLGPQLNTEAPDKLLVGGKEIEIRFVGWQFDPNSEPETQPLEYEMVELFSRAWWRKNAEYIIVVLGILAMALGIFLPPFLRRRKMRQQRIAIREAWYKQVEAASDLGSLSMLWQQRDQFLGAWEDKQPNIQAFFHSLNQYQFRPVVAEDDLKLLLKRKQELALTLKEGIHGV